MGFGITQAASVPDADWKVWLAAVALPFVLQPALKWGLRNKFKKTTHVRFTKDQFLIRTWPKTKEFDRLRDHSFQFLDHDNQQKEKDRLQLVAMKAQKQGKLVSPTKYYGESFHLV